jgi:hypothetical protein
MELVRFKERNMKFRKKPVAIDAVLWTGGNPNELTDFMGKHPKIVENKRMRITTLEGAIYAEVGDWIIKGVNGEYYPCKPDIFEKTYDKV